MMMWRRHLSAWLSNPPAATTKTNYLDGRTVYHRLMYAVSLLCVETLLGISFFRYIYIYFHSKKTKRNRRKHNENQSRRKVSSSSSYSLQLGKRGSRHTIFQEHQNLTSQKIKRDRLGGGKHPFHIKKSKRS